VRCSARIRFAWSDLSPEPHPNPIVPAPVEETGKTFRAKRLPEGQLLRPNLNCCDHSRRTAALRSTRLNRNPGVYSARWAEINNTGRGDAANNACLLEQIRDVPNEKRTGRFVCVLALANPQGVIIITVRDTIEGRLVHEPRGENGFGYDPLFLIDGLGKTTAELPAIEKHQIIIVGKRCESSMR